MFSLSFRCLRCVVDLLGCVDECLDFWGSFVLKGLSTDSLVVKLPFAIKGRMIDEV